MRSPARRKRLQGRKGAALVEFTISFMVFLMVFLVLLEFMRALNVGVTLNTVAAAAAGVGTVDDPLASVSTSEIESAARANLARFGYLDPAQLDVSVDRNYQTSLGTFHTRVIVNYDMKSVFFPMPWNPGGVWRIGVAAVRPNEIQMFRPEPTP